MGKSRHLNPPEISRFIHLEAEEVLKQIPGLIILCLWGAEMFLRVMKMKILGSSAKYTLPAERLGVLRGCVVC